MEGVEGEAIIAAFPNKYRVLEIPEKVFFLGGGGGEEGEEEERGEGKKKKSS